MIRNYIDEFDKEKIAIIFENEKQLGYFFELNYNYFYKYKNGLNATDISKKFFKEQNFCLLLVYQKGLYGYNKEDGLAFADAIDYEVLKFSDVKPKVKIMTVNI